MIIDILDCLLHKVWDNNDLLDHLFSTNVEI